MKLTREVVSHALSALFVAALLTPSGRATVLFDSGAATFTGGEIQFGRISRNGEASTWGSIKDFPGVVDGAARQYEFFTVDSGIFPFLQISLDDPTAGLFMAAYLDSFNPVNSPPNFGLDVNYLGDPGSSQPAGNPSFFQIQVVPHSLIVVPINEVNPGAGNGRPFDLIVEGFLDASFSDVPEPSTLVLIGAGLAALMAGRARGSKRAPRREI